MNKQSWAERAVRWWMAFLIGIMVYTTFFVLFSAGIPRG